MELDPQEVAKVTQYFFKRYTQENNVPPDNHPDVTPYEFLGWLQNYQLDVMGIAENLEVSPTSVSYVANLATDPTGPNRIIGMWPYIILSQRVTKEPLRSMQLFLVLTWEDQVVAPLSVFLHKDVVPEKLDDAVVCSTVTTYAQNLLTEVMDKGLDGIHESRQHNGLFGASRVIQLAQDLVNGIKTRKEIPDADMAAVNQLLHFVSSMFISEIPQEMVDKIKAQAEAEGGTATNEGGGFNA